MFLKCPFLPPSIPADQSYCASASFLDPLNPCNEIIITHPHIHCYRPTRWKLMMALLSWSDAAFARCISCSLATSSASFPRSCSSSWWQLFLYRFTSLRYFAIDASNFSYRQQGQWHTKNDIDDIDQQIMISTTRSTNLLVLDAISQLH